MKTGSLVAGLLAGAAIGAVAGLLAAPKAGKETREMLSDRATEVRNRAGEYVDIIKEKLNRGEEIAEEHSANGAQTRG